MKFNSSSVEFVDAASLQKNIGASSSIESTFVDLILLKPETESLERRSSNKEASSDLRYRPTSLSDLSQALLDNDDLYVSALKEFLNAMDEVENNDLLEAFMIRKNELGVTEYTDVSKIVRDVGKVKDDVNAYVKVSKLLNGLKRNIDGIENQTHKEHYRSLFTQIKKLATTTRGVETLELFEDVSGSVKRYLTLVDFLTKKSPFSKVKYKSYKENFLKLQDEVREAFYKSDLGSAYKLYFKLNTALTDYLLIVRNFKRVDDLFDTLAYFDRRPEFRERQSKAFNKFNLGHSKGVKVFLDKLIEDMGSYNSSLGSSAIGDGKKIMQNTPSITQLTDEFGSHSYGSSDEDETSEFDGVRDDTKSGGSGEYLGFDDPTAEEVEAEEIEANTNDDFDVNKKRRELVRKWYKMKPAKGGKSRVVLEGRPDESLDAQLGRVENLRKLGPRLFESRRAKLLLYVKNMFIKVEAMSSFFDLDEQEDLLYSMQEALSNPMVRGKEVNITKIDGAFKEICEMVRKIEIEKSKPVTFTILLHVECLKLGISLFKVLCGQSQKSWYCCG